MRPPGDALNPPEDTTPEDKPKAEEKKKKASGADNSFTQMLAGLKALQPPPVNPVGTPSVRGPLASGAPNLSQLLQVMGAQTRPGVAETLGKLLVQGKA
jgi:hypothetical protein